MSKAETHIYMGQGQTLSLLVRVDILNMLAEGKRWTVGRKKAVIDALEAKLVTPEEVHQYGIDQKEVASWKQFGKLEDIVPDAVEETPPKVSSPAVQPQSDLMIDGWRFVRRSKTWVKPERLPNDVEVTPLQHRVLTLLTAHRGEIVTKYLIYDTLYRGSKKTRRMKIIDVILNGLRNKLKSSETGIVINPVWGRGYILPLRNKGGGEDVSPRTAEPERSESVALSMGKTF